MDSIRILSSMFGFDGNIDLDSKEKIEDLKARIEISANKEHAGILNIQQRILFIEPHIFNFFKLLLSKESVEACAGLTDH